jgi:hypothetical protein
MGTDKSGMLRFFNLRSQLWWMLRERSTRPTTRASALPPHPRLKADLCAPKWQLQGKTIRVGSARGHRQAHRPLARLRPARTCSRCSTRPSATGYSVGNYDTATGGNMRIYDTSGKDTGQSEFWERDKYAWTDTAAMAAMASFVGAFAAAAAGGATTAAGTTSTGPNFATGFTDTGTAGGVAGDAYAGSGAVTGTTGGVTTGGSSLLTGPTSVNADYSLLTGTEHLSRMASASVLEGNSGQRRELRRAAAKAWR